MQLKTSNSLKYTTIERFGHIQLTAQILCKTPESKYLREVKLYCVSGNYSSVVKVVKYHYS